MTTAPLGYGAFTFVVSIAGRPFGGFSEISGLDSGIHSGDLALKRGVIDAYVLREWLGRAGTSGVAARKDVMVSLFDERRNVVQSWTLRGVIPKKFTGPTLSGKSGGDVPMEEIVLSADGIELA
jgi:phage tail-like protein